MTLYPSYAAKIGTPYKKWYSVLFGVRKRLLLAERVGFEPTSRCRLPDFESGPLWPLRYRSLFYDTSDFGVYLRPLGLVEVARLELAASWSRTMRATNCATPRYRKHCAVVYLSRPAVSVVERKTGIEPATFSLGSYCSTIEPFPHFYRGFIISSSIGVVKLFFIDFWFYWISYGNPLDRNHIPSPIYKTIIRIWRIRIVCLWYIAHIDINNNGVWGAFHIDKKRGNLIAVPLAFLLWFCYTFSRINGNSARQVWKWKKKRWQ